LDTEAHSKIPGQSLVGPYVFMTYRDALRRIDSLHNALTAHNALVPNDDGMKLLAIYARNCPEWVLMEQAAYCGGGATVPLYDTLGPETVEFVLAQSGASCCVCSSNAEASVQYLTFANVATCSQPLGCLSAL
jgi:long-chain acyl-CoA synthetase